MSLLAPLAAALFSVAPASASTFLNGAVSSFPDRWSVSSGTLAEVTSTNGVGALKRLEFALDEDQTLTYTAPTASDAGGTADVVISNAVFTTAYEYPGVEEVGGIDSQAAICVHTNGTGGLEYCGWAGEYIVDGTTTNLTWIALSGATPVEGATNTVTMSFNYTGEHPTVTFKIGETELTPKPVALSTAKTQVSAVSFSGQGSISELAGESAPAALSTVEVSFFDEGAAAAFWSTNVPVGDVPVFLGTEPSKQPTAQYTYEFAGWTNATVTTATKTFSDPVTAPTNYYATYTATPVSYTLAWDPNGGTITSEAGTYTAAGSVAYGTTLTPPTVAKTGYTFNVWSPSVDATMPAANASYTATWTPNTDTAYKVEHYQQALDGTYPAEPTNTDSLTGTTGEQTAATAKSYTGFTAGTVTQSAIAADGSTVVTIQYTRNSYQLTFDANGGTGGTSATVLYGAAISAPTVTWTGHTFNGWSPSVDATMPAADTTYTAQWDTDSYTLAWNLDGGSITSEAGTYTAAGSVAYGTTLTPPTVAKTGYTFNVWSPSVDATMPAANASYTATWTPNTDTAYKVEHYQQALDGTYPAEPTNTDSLTGTTGEQTAATAKSYTGFTAGTVTQSAIAADGSTVVTIQYTRNSYQLTFDANGGTGGTSATVLYGAAISAPTVTWTGHTFNGWSPSVDATMPAVDTTYTAQWNTDSYTLAWNLDGGSITSEAGTYTAAGSVAYGTSLTAPQVAKTGYTFGGWSPSVDATMPAANTTYTATWTANKYAITFVDYDETVLEAATQYDYGTSVADIAKPANPTRDPSTTTIFTFAGWSPDLAPVTQAQTYTATYNEAPRPYALGWDANGGTLSGDYTAAGSVANGASITAPTATREGFTFGGWDPAFTGTMPAADTTYTAQWSQIPVLALAKPTLGSTVLADGVAGATVKVTVDPAAVVTATNANVAFTSEGGVTNATFTSLPWNEAVDWKLQSEGAADLPGRFYAKGEAEWFNVATNALVDITGLYEGMKGVDSSSAPSAAGQMVRIQTCLEIPEGPGMEELPDAQSVGDARTGFAVAKLEGDDGNYFYAFNGTTWDKLSGATPVANTTNDLLVVLDVEAQTARYYVDGVALYKDNAGTHVYALPMKQSQTAVINGIGFANPDGVLSPVVAEYDVPFEAAVGDTPYAAAADGLAAADLTGAETLYLLTNDVVGTISLAVGESVKVDTAKGSFAEAEPVVTSASGYEVVSSVSGNVTTYTVDPIAYAISYELDGGAWPTGYTATNTYTITSPAITLASPEKTDYNFLGWIGTGLTGTNATVTIASGSTGDRAYTSIWQRAAVQIRFLNYNGDVLQSSLVDIGQTPVYAGETPAKPATAQYTFTFNGWDPAIAEATVAADYTATFSETLRSYDVTFSWHGDSETTSYEYGQTPTAPSVPASYVDNGVIYTFQGWNAEIVSVTGAATYTAVYDNGVTAEAVVITIADAGATTNRAYYASFAAAFDAAPAGSTIQLLDDVSTSGRPFTVTDDLTIDLNGNDIVFTDAGRLNRLVVLGGDFAIVNTSETAATVKEANPDMSPVMVYGHAVGDPQETTSVYVGEGVTLDGWAGLFVNSNTAKTDGHNTSDGNAGISIEVDGSLIGRNDGAGNANSSGHGFYVNGNVDQTVTVVLGDTAYVTSDKTAIYAAGDVDLTVNGATVTGLTAIEVRAGSVTIEDGSVITSTYTGEPTVTANGNGATVVGAALAVSQHNTRHPVTVTVNGGTFSGPASVIVTDPENGDPTDVAVALNGGTFQNDVVIQESAESVGPIIPATVNGQPNPARFADAEADGVQPGYILAEVPNSSPAMYQVVQAVVVTFVNAKGEAPAAQTNAINTAATQPADPAAVEGWTFGGWYTNLVAGAAWDFDDPVVEDITLNAKWTVNAYDVIWVADGSQFASNRVDYGTNMPVPTTNPSKAATQQLTYAFAGWTPEPTATVYSNATYTAVFTETTNKYDVIWVADGSQFASNRLDYGTAIVAPSPAPTKPATAQFTYEFAGWTPLPTSTVFSNATYAAVFNEVTNQYTVIWIVDGTPTTNKVDYGTVTASIQPDNPTKPDTASAVYTFTGWSPAVAETVTQDAIYTAGFSALTLDPVAQELYYNCTSQVAVVGAPEGATFYWAEEVIPGESTGTSGGISFSGSTKPLSVSSGRKTDTLKFYSNNTNGVWHLTASVTNDNAEVAQLVATVTVKDVAAVVGGVEYTKAQLADAAAAAIANDEILGLYVNGPAVTLAAGQTIKVKALSDKNKDSIGKLTVTGPAGTDGTVYVVGSTVADGVRTYSLTAEEPSVMFVSADGVTTNYLDAAFKATAAGTYTLLKDVSRSQLSVGTAGVVLDLNGKTFTSTATGTTAAINVTSTTGTASLTVVDSSEAGTGAIVAPNYSAIQSGKNGSVAIEGGAISGKTVVVYTTSGGTAAISGGTFAMVSGSADSMLNCQDSNRGTISVTGGSFDGFDPATSNAADGDMVAEGYWSFADDPSAGWYTVAEKKSVIGTTITVADAEYDGTAKEPVPAVEFDGAALTATDDYTVAYAANTNAGTATVTITGVNGWKDATNVTFTIAQKPATFTAASDTKTYDGNALVKDAFTPSGLVSGHTATATVVGTQTDVGVSSNVVSAAVVKDADNVDVTANYAFTYVDGELEVTPAAMAITVAGTASTAVYTGEAQTTNVAWTATSETAGFDSTKIVYDGSTTVSGTNVGTYNYGLAVSQFSYGDSNYTATFTVTDAAFEITSAKVAVPTAIAGLVYNGNLQTGVVEHVGYTLTGNTATDAGDSYVATATLAANYEWDADPATGTKTIPWSIAKAPLSDLAVTLTGWTEGDTGTHTPSVTGNAGTGTETITYSADGENWSGTQPTEAGTYTVRVEVAETANYLAGSATSPFVIAERGKVTVIWIVDNVETSVQVDYGSSPSFTGSTEKAPDGKYSYTFAGWNDGTTQYGPTDNLPGVTEETTYTATYTQSIATKLALPLADPELGSTAVNGTAATVALAPAGLLDGTQVAVEPAGTTYEAGTLSFSGLAWNQGVDWSVSAAQGEGALAETAANAGRFYAKPETIWFETNELVSVDGFGGDFVGVRPASPSATGETVRVHTTIEVPADGLAAAPEVGDARTGFAVLQLQGDAKPAFYALGKDQAGTGKEWVKLSGVEPAEGEAQLLMVFDMAAESPAAYYYIDGVALYAGTAANPVYAVPMVGDDKAIDTVGFASAGMVKSAVVGEQDVSYVAVVDETPYTNAAQVVEAVGSALGTADTATVTLLANGVEGSVSLATGKSVTVAAGSYTSGLAFTAAGAPAEKVVETAGDPATTVTYSVAPNEATVIWIGATGTTLYETNYVYGATPVYVGDEPAKARTDQFTYAFDGWSDVADGAKLDPLPAVDGPTNYYAVFTFTTNAYEITWKNEDGSVIDTTTVDYDILPTHADAYKAPDAQFTYAFKAWTPEVVPVTGAAAYTATFTSNVNQYTVAWLPDGGSLSGDYTTGPVNYGTPLVAPTAAKDGNVFAGWTPAPTDAVYSNATYTATWTPAVATVFSVAEAEGNVVTNTVGYYASLAEAIGAAQDGDTVLLLADAHMPAVEFADKYGVSSAQGDSEIVINKAITLDGDGHTIYGVDNYFTHEMADGCHDLFISGANDVTIKNVTLSDFGGSAYVSKFTYPIWTGQGYTGTLVLDNVTVTNYNRTAFNFNGGTVVVTNCTVVGDAPTPRNANGAYFQNGIGVLNANVTVYDSAISGIGAHDDDHADSNDAECFQVVGTGSITVNGGTYSGQHAAIVGDDASGTITLNGGDFTGTLVVEDGSAGTLVVNGGTFAGEVDKTESITVNGGWFNAKVPDEAVPAGMYATDALADAPNASYPYTVLPQGSILDTTISVATDLEYDGTGQAGVTNVAFNGTSLVAGTDYTVSYAANTNAGDAATAAITGIGAWKDTTNVTFSIAQKPLTVTAASDTKTYDGTALVKDAYTAGALAAGDTIAAATVTGSRTDVGAASNKVEVTSITNAVGAEVIGNYAITAVDGELVVTPATMTITVAGYTGIYDGASHAATYEASQDGVTVVWSTDGGETWSDTVPSVTDVGAAVSVLAKASKANYADAVSETAATLQLTARAATFTAASATKVYDGTALSTNGFATAGLVAGHTATATVTGSQTVVGASSNEVSQAVVLDGESNDVTANYAITYADGALTVTAAVVDIPAAPGNKTYNGAAQTADVATADTYTVTNEGGTNAGDYTVVFALSDAANYTWSDGSTTNQTFGWSITPAAAIVKADDDSKKHGEADPESFSATVTGLQGSDTEAVLSYTVSRAAGEDVGTYTITPAGDAAQGNYTVTYQTGTFTIESNEITIIWVVDGSETTNKVEWGEMPAFAGSTAKEDATGKYAYAFTGWTPEVTNATAQATYTAGYSTAIATPLALPLADPELASTVVDGSTATVALAPTGTIAGVAFSASPETATWSDENATLSFADLDWNQGVDWSVSGAQGEAALAETASNAGRFYAKPETAWFTATTNDFHAVSGGSDAAFAYTNEVASPEGEMVRVHTKVEVPVGGLPQAPDTGSAKVGFAVLQLEGDEAPAYYAYGNGTWTKLAGAAPEAGEHDYYAVYDLAADTPTARYYIDGRPLYVAVDGGDDVYALPLAATTRSLSGISFASKEMVKDDVVAEYDVSYVAAVGQTPYTAIADAVAAQGKDPAKTLALLKADVGLAAPVSLGATTEKFVVDYAKGSFTNETVAVSGVAGYAVKETSDGSVTNYALDAIVYPIEYVLGLDGAAIADNFPTEYTVETLPVTLPGAAREGWTFDGWTNNVSGNAIAQTIPVGTLGAVTNVGQWRINQYDVIWVADGAMVASNRLDYGASIAAPAENPTKGGDAGALYTFVGWTPAPDSTVSSNATYVAEFKTWTKVAVPEAKTGLVYDGTEQTGVATGTGYTLANNTGVIASNYVATASLADPTSTVWADATEVDASATADRTIAWSIAPATMTITVAGYTGIYDGASHAASAETVPEGATVTWSVDGGEFSDTVPSVTGVTNVTIVAKATMANYTDATATTSLVVTARALTVTAGSDSKVYDGSALTKDTVSGDNLVAGHTVTATVTGSQTEVGSSANVPSLAVVRDGADQDVTANYAIDYANGTLEVTPAVATIPAAATGLTYNGQEQTGVEAGTGYTISGNKGTNADSYAATLTLAANYKWSDDTTDATKTVAWEIGKAAATITVDNASKKHGEADPAFNGTVQGLFADGDLGAVSYGRTNAAEAVGVYAGVIVPTYTANDNYTVTVTPGTFTIESNEITIIWVVDGSETTNKVEWGEMPAFAGSTAKEDATGKYAYAFTGWTPEVTNATAQATYTAGYSQSIAIPLALPLADPELASTVVDGSTATVALDPVGTITGVAFSASPETATWSDENATLSFADLDWNQGVDWSVSGAQGEAALAETASNAGRFYAKPETAWFTATTDDMVALTDSGDAAFGITTNASPEGEMVRIHTTVEVPVGGLPQTPEVGSAKSGFAVLQLEGDAAPAYYAFAAGTAGTTGTGWTRLAGVAPEAGDHDYLAVYDFAAEAPAVRYYIDGIALYAEGEGGAKTYAVPLAATTKSLSSISFASKEMVKSEVVAEHDVSYVAAVGQTPYTNIIDAVAAQGKDPAKPLALLKEGVGLAAPVSLDATTEKFVVDYAKGSFTNETPAVSGVAGYAVKETAAGSVTNYALDAIVYPIEYVPGLDGAAIADNYPTEYTVETLPVTLPGAAREGWTFDGWTNNVSGDQIAATIPVGTIGAVTNVGQWRINDYQLTVNYLYATGGVAATAFQSNVVYGTAYSVPSPVVTGYTPSVATVSGTMGAAPVTTNVVYTINRYTVAFVDEDGATVLKAATAYDYGTPAADIAQPETTPTKAADANFVYEFGGWKPALADVTDDATYTAFYTSNATVAAVISVADNGDGTATTNTTYVATLAEAIAAAEDGDTVQLLANVEEPAAAIVDDITIDLNGKTWTVTPAEGESEPGTVTVSGAVAIVDNSQGGGGTIASASDPVVTVAQGGALTLDDGVSVTVPDGAQPGTAVQVAAGGALVVDDADIDGDVTVAGATGEVPAGSVQIAGGSVNGDVTASGEDAAVTISGGEVDGDVNVINGASVAVSGGTVTGDIDASGADSSVAVSGGDVEGGIVADSGAEVRVTDGSVGDGIEVGDGSSVEVSGGEVAGGISGAGDITVSGGDVTGCIDADGTLEITGGTVTAAVGADEPAISASGTATISGGTVSGNVAVTGGGSATISGNAEVEGNVTVSGTDPDDPNTPSSVVVVGGTVDGNVLASNGGTAAVSDGEVTGSLVASGDDSHVSVTDDGTVGSVSATNGGSAVIAGGTVENGITASGNNAVEVTGGTVNGTITGEEGSVGITGGHFENDPSDHLADGYVAIPDTENGGYDVRQGKSVIGTTITVAGGTYNGSPYAIGSVVLGDYTLTADDYTVTYANAIDAATTNANDNVNAGTVIATVTGKGEWIDSTNVTFTISKAHLTITADNVTVPLHTPAGAVPYSISYSGFVNDETNTVFTTQPTVGSDYAATAVAGDTFTITVSGAVAANYDISFATGTLTVGPAEAPTMLETTSITVAGTDVTLLHRIQSDAAYHTFFTCTDLTTGAWVAAEDSRPTGDIETVVVQDANGVEYTAGTVTFHNVEDNARFYQIGYSSLPYAAGEAMGVRAVDGGEQP